MKLPLTQLYNLEAGVEDHKNRLKTAANIRKEIEATFKNVKDANEIVQVLLINTMVRIITTLVTTILQVLLTDDMKSQLNGQVEELLGRSKTNDDIDERLKFIDEFNGKIKNHFGVVADLEKWNEDGRKRMDELLNPPAPIEAEDRVLMTMELGEDITKQLEIVDAQEVPFIISFKMLNLDHPPESVEQRTWAGEGLRDHRRVEGAGGEDGHGQEQPERPQQRVRDRRGEG